MNQPATINSRIIESLYCEALVLSDEVRHAFDLSAPVAGGQRSLAEETARAALSSEALRTTTRMMHALAWLLNQRAYLAGELSELQLLRYGRLKPDTQMDANRVGTALTAEMMELVRATEQFYARLHRLDQTWRDRDPQPAVAELYQRIGSALAVR